MSTIQSETLNDNASDSLLDNSNNKGIIARKNYERSQVPGNVKNASQEENSKTVTYQKIRQKEKGPAMNSNGDRKVIKKVQMVEDTDNEDWERVPPDGGWGWLVLCGSMLVNILVPGTVKSFGVLFVEFLEVFNATPAAAAWIPALCYFLYSSLGPLSSILSVKYSYRTVTIIGGTFAAVGMILSFWAQSVTYLYVSYGVLVGTGAGLSFPPTVYIVTSYFVKLRGLANGLCISGSAIGSIILPPILRILLETYGYRGAVLIMGAVTLNVWVGAMFYHPVEQHMKKVRKQKKKEIEETDDVDNKPLSESKAEFMIHIDDQGCSGDKEDVTFTMSSEKLDDQNINKVDETPIENLSDTPKYQFIRSASTAAVQNYKKPLSPVSHRTRKISVSYGKDQTKSKVVSVKSQIRSTPALHAPARNTNRSLDFFSHSRLPNSRRATVKLPRRSPSTSSFQYVSTPYHGSTLSALHPEEFASSLTLRSLSLNPVATCCKGSNDIDQPETQKNKYFDITLLKDPLYLVILISNSTNAISYTNFIILLPSYAIMLGFDKGLAAWLISIVSALDLVGRIGGSALSDIELIPKQWYFIGGLLVSGMALTALPFAETYAMLSIYCAFFGLASGVYVGVTAVIMADMLGTERLTSTYGISLFVNGILQLIGPPLCGLWFQQVGTYVPLFTTLGIVLIVGASIWGFVPFIKKKQTVNVSNS